MDVAELDIYVVAATCIVKLALVVDKGRHGEKELSLLVVIR